MKIIIGLGNPGLRYKNTRHNAGFLALNALSKKYHIVIKKKGFKGIYGIGHIKRKEIMLFEPLTFMNLSGEAVQGLCSKIDVKPDLLVISDDVNLPLGAVRLREKGSSGGHNGLKSIIERIGTDFARLRIGIGSDEKILDMAGYVLRPFFRKERAVLNDVIERIVECVEIWTIHGIKPAMNECNKGAVA